MSLSGCIVNAPCSLGDTLLWVTARCGGGNNKGAQGVTYRVVVNYLGLLLGASPFLSEHCQEAIEDIRCCCRRGDMHTTTSIINLHGIFQ